MYTERKKNTVTNYDWPKLKLWESLTVLEQASGLGNIFPKIGGGRVGVAAHLPVRRE